MSNYVVSKGLAGGFLTTQGWGGIGVPEAGAIVRLSTGAMRINVSKVGANVVLTYSDSSNNTTDICNRICFPFFFTGGRM